MLKYQFNIMNQVLVDKYVDTHYQLHLIKQNIYRTHHMHPFACDDSILEVLKPGILGAMESYKSTNFVTPFDFSSLTIKDIIKGYYDIFLMKNELSTLNTVSSKDMEFTFTNEKWGKMIKVMIAEMKYDQSFFDILVRLQNKIDDVFEGYGIELPSIYTLEKKLIDLYVKTIESQRPFLPPIEQLAVNDTLYVVNFAHGDVDMKNQNMVYTNERPPPTVDIPMNFYRIMASEYGAIACTSPKETEKYISIIDNFLKIQRKNTDRNNKKIIKRIIATLLKKTRDFMKNKKNRIKTSVQKQKKFDETDAHVHYVKDSKIILKNYYVYLTDHESIDEIYVGNPDFNVNLLHYIDFKIKNGVIEFNLEDIIKVIKHIKYILFIDLSCSNGNATNKESNNFKSLAKRIEGPSITKQMEMHLNLSPYDETIQTNKKSKKRRTKSLSLRSKSKKYKRIMSTSKSYVSL